MTDRFATVPAQARDFQGQRAGIVTRVAAAAVDFLLVIIAICLIYGGIAGVTFIIHPRSFHWPSNTGWTLPVLYFLLLLSLQEMQRANWFFIGTPWADAWKLGGPLLIAIVLVLTVYSALGYFAKNWKLITSGTDF